MDIQVFFGSMSSTKTVGAATRWCFPLFSRILGEVIGISATEGRDRLTHASGSTAPRAAHGPPCLCFRWMEVHKSQRGEQAIARVDGNMVDPLADAETAELRVRG